MVHKAFLGLAVNQAILVFLVIAAFLEQMELLVQVV